VDCFYLTKRLFGYHTAHGDPAAIAMRVGIYCDLRNPPAWRRPWDALYARTLDRIVEAERLGIGSVWLTEHHLFEDGYLPQPLTFAAAIAARTRSVRIGTAIMLAPLRPALAIAEEAAVVDILSGGRLELGIGAGYRVPEYEAYGADVTRRFELLEERAREIRRLWDEGICMPPPIQERPPLWLGVMGPRGAEMAGRLGEGLLWLDTALLEPYRRGLVAGGHDPASARMSGLVNVILADDPESARERIAPHLAYQNDSYRRYANEGGGVARRHRPGRFAADKSPPRTERPPPERPRNALPPQLHVLSCDEAIELLSEWLADAPVLDIFTWDSVAGMPDDLADRHVELVATRLAPALADVGSPPARSVAHGVGEEGDP
jgi:alkanesulfonate monooxygenase SsuD/methylene tetrahydromethanopterin reductase-like flavin-dependent oxidoreductase (luciferase family)